MSPLYKTCAVQKLDLVSPILPLLRRGKKNHNLLHWPLDRGKISGRPWSGYIHTLQRGGREWMTGGWGGHSSYWSTDNDGPSSSHIWNRCKPTSITRGYLVNNTWQTHCLREGQKIKPHHVQVLGFEISWTLGIIWIPFSFTLGSHTFLGSWNLNSKHYIFLLYRTWKDWVFDLTVRKPRHELDMVGSWSICWKTLATGDRQGCSPI
jgi:hypothetical protein